MLAKPNDVFDRDGEWADLADFVGSTLPGLRIAVIYGRRRQGKSYLLRRLAEAAGGLYHLATEQTEPVSVRRFARALSSWQRLPAGAFGFDGWEAALDAAAALMTTQSETRGDQSQPPLLILDEFPYLAHETPGLASIVQGLYDRVGPGGMSRPPPLRLVLCGSAISIMSDLLSGSRALRGRGALELCVQPFGFRAARGYWRIDDVNVAFLHNALIGGTPGYRELVPDPDIPEKPGLLGAWVARNVLRPGVPLFDEANRIVHEDPRVRDTAAYGSVLAAIAAGEGSPSKIGGLLGRPATSLTHQLRMLEAAGFVERRQDLLLERRPALTVADPVVRLHHLVIEPYLGELEAGRAERVWGEVKHTVDSKILGPHFEAMASAWVAQYAAEEAGLAVGATGQAVVSCREHRASHEIDIIALVRGARPRTPGTPVAFLGEAKSRDRRPGLAELRRLEHVRDLLTAAGHDAMAARMGIFSRTGFTAQLAAEARAARPPILLVGLDDLYGRPAR